ncbi:MAG: energy-coupling factor ABC transporter ATP-binding protein [Treponema sp.]|jgi:energy-coupling factor transport system ATP-binding protein|nr:energy-coupling factor ABC transporter ATP-binding protein [Treponema sp.]
MNMLRLENAGFGYGRSMAVTDISFSLEEGEFAVLLGENGAGKSTLCRLCGGLVKPSSGRVINSGQDTRTAKASLLARNTGFLFQNPDRQICRNTVREEIMFGLEYTAGGGNERERRCDEMLELLSLDGSADPFSMSRGERQKTALASVLARKPSLLILDEPTTGLDYRECVTIMEAVSALHREGTAVLMITHDMEIAADFAVRALVLNRGRLAADGPIRTIMKNRTIMEEASLLPAQIPALAMEMGLDGVFTLDEMYAAASS